jgi:hypothetical protein
MPFGGINVVLCGDFAQLTPVKGVPLYSGDLFSGKNSMTTSDQENAIGKSIWQQFTNVVLLKQNMQQRSMSPEDQAYRVALENMQYKACTSTDVALLYSLSSNTKDEKDKLKSNLFRAISILTSQNKYRDKINDMGSDRYAHSTGQTLSQFYSIDTLIEVAVKSNKYNGYKEGQD